MTRHLYCAFLCAFCLCIASSLARASSQFVLITNDLQSVPIRLLGVDEHTLRYIETEADRRHARPLSECIAILRDPPPERPSGSAGRGDQGMLRLADGRQFPGESATPSPVPPPRMEPAGASSESFAWHSNWLGRTEVRLSEIDWIVFRPTASGRTTAPPPPGRADVVLLVNGDTLTGFITSIRQTIAIEVDNGDGTGTVEVPLDRVAAVNMVGGLRAGDVASSRAWLADGTILNVDRIEIDEAGVGRLTGTGFSGGARVDLRHVAAVLLSPGRMVPLASLDIREVSGPETRYVIPEPEMVDPDALLGLSPIELRGPLSVEFELPKGAKRFAAEVVLPEASRRWGDLSFVVRAGDSGRREIFRQQLNAAHPRASINVELLGEALSIEIVAGEPGSVQNHVILHRAMITIK